MERRAVIKNLLLTGGSLALVGSYSCSPEGTFIYKHFKLGQKELELLELVTETIIPATKVPGAKELQIHFFVLKMIEDCYEPVTQQRFVDGLKQLNGYSKSKEKRAFIEMKQKEREHLLEEVSAGKQVAPDLKFFLAETRKHTIKGYLNSKLVMTELLPYVQVPGHFTGCMKIKK